MSRPLLRHTGHTCTGRGGAPTPFCHSHMAYCTVLVSEILYSFYSYMYTVHCMAMGPARGPRTFVENNEIRKAVKPYDRYNINRHARRGVDRPCRSRNSCQTLCGRAARACAETSHESGRRGRSRHAKGDIPHAGPGTGRRGPGRELRSRSHLRSSSRRSLSPPTPPSSHTRYSAYRYDQPIRWRSCSKAMSDTVVCGPIRSHCEWNPLNRASGPSFRTIVR